MNILLLDDDDYIVEAVKSMVNWEKIGIDGVFTASDPGQARQILEKVPIEIMLCDIEMGSESGLEFVQWVREQGNEAKVVFLTSYAEFSYAQKAIALNSAEYLLKPVKFEELEKILERLCGEIHEQSDWIKNKEKWMQSKPVRTEGFWRKILVDQLEIQDYQEQQEWFGLTYSEQQQFLFLQISILDYALIYEKLERGMLNFLIRNMTEELFSKNGCKIETVFRVDGEDISWWYLIMKLSEQGISREEMEVLGQECLRKFRDLMHSKACLYVGIPKPLRDIAKSAREVMRMAEEGMYTGDAPQFLLDYKQQEIPYEEPSFLQWETMLLEGKMEEMLIELEKYLGHLQIFGYNSKVLRSFLADFQQMIYVVLRKRNIAMSRLLEAPGKEEGNLAVHSVAHMKEYAISQVKQAVSGMDFVSREESVVETVKRYMEAHLGEDLSREDFAAQVYLNGDYLARLFKKETGMSIGNYLQKMRMQRAKQLLYETKKPVNEIAEEVGYTNFSYFAKLFRKTEGMRPNEYRKQYCH